MNRITQIIEQLHNEVIDQNPGPLTIIGGMCSSPELEEKINNHTSELFNAFRKEQIVCKLMKILD